MKYTLEHYYGDIVRYLFITAAVLMIIGLPIFQDYIQWPLMISIIAITILGVAAGLTNPKQTSSAVVNLLISVIGLIVFTYTSVTAINMATGDDKYLLTNIVLSLIFIFATYFAMKTVRAKMLDPNQKESE